MNKSLTIIGVILLLFGLGMIVYGSIPAGQQYVKLFSAGTGTSLARAGGGLPYWQSAFIMTILGVIFLALGIAIKDRRKEWKSRV